MKSKAQQFRPRANQSARVTPPHLDRKKTRSNPAEEIHFASSAFLNSPDPSKLPVPDFDDEEEVETEFNNRLMVAETTPIKVSPAPMSVVGKADTLKQFLNIRPVSN